MMSFPYVEKRNCRFLATDESGVLKECPISPWGDTLYLISRYPIFEVWEDDWNITWKSTLKNTLGFNPAVCVSPKPSNTMNGGCWTAEAWSGWRSLPWMDPPEYLQPHPSEWRPHPSEWRMYKNYKVTYAWGQPQRSPPFFLVQPLCSNPRPVPSATALSRTEHHCAQLGPFAADVQKVQRAKNTAYFGLKGHLVSSSKKRQYPELEEE